MCRLGDGQKSETVFNLALVTISFCNCFDPVAESDLAVTTKADSSMCLCMTVM